MPVIQKRASQETVDRIVKKILSYRTIPDTAIHAIVVNDPDLSPSMMLPVSKQVIAHMVANQQMTHVGKGRYAIRRT